MGTATKGPIVVKKISERPNMDSKLALDLNSMQHHGGADTEESVKLERMQDKT